MNRAIQATLICGFLTVLAAFQTRAEMFPAPDREQAIEALFLMEAGEEGGPVAAVRDRLWAMANTMAMTGAAPRIRMGFMFFRGPAGARTPASIPLTEDIDRAYLALLLPGPERDVDAPDAGRALLETVGASYWSESPDDYRVIFLLGRAFGSNPEDGGFRAAALLARERDIVINVILFHGDSAGVRAGEEIAGLSGGTFFRIDGTGSGPEIATPYDAELARLSRELDASRIDYGTNAMIAQIRRHQAVANQIYLAAPESALACRAQFNASPSGSRSWAGPAELLEDIAGGRAAIDDMALELMPELLREMSPEGRDEYITDVIMMRMGIQEKIETIGALRQMLIEKEMAAKGAGRENSLDGIVFSCLRQQAGNKGISYYGGPVF